MNNPFLRKGLPPGSQVYSRDSGMLQISSRLLLHSSSRLILIFPIKPHLFLKGHGTSVPYCHFSGKSRPELPFLFMLVLCLCFVYLSAWAGAIPSYATAPALVFVACLMAKNLKDINWDDLAEYIPAVVMVLAMPLTFSIATGIGFGFISYALIKIFSGRFNDLSVSVLTISGLFLIKFIVG